MVWEIIPKPGRIRIYTSGCPKNQNRCWNKIGSPPPDGSKKEVLKFRSVRSMVIAPAKTGIDNKSKIAVINTDHTNNGVSSILIDEWRMFKIVVIKLIAPRIDEAPAKWREKIVKSIEILGWKISDDRGG